MDGLLVLDKPQGVTSRAALDRALRWLPRGTKAGHTGTLDPLATGVLVLCLGRATRLAEYVQRMTKAYSSTFTLSAVSDTDDAKGRITPTPGAADPGVERVRRELARFVGAREQVPPAFSAAHVSGARAHDLARQGRAVHLEPRTVQLYSIDVTRYDYPEVDVVLECGKGFYVRSLARDLGAALGAGGYVSRLRRLRVGPFVPEMAPPQDAQAEEAVARVLPSEMAVQELPAVELPPDHLGRLIHGSAVPHPFSGECVVTAGGHAVAVAQGDGEFLRPTKVLRATQG
jgi:tRNA pseudouridine55 synthase